MRKAKKRSTELLIGAINEFENSLEMAEISHLNDTKENLNDLTSHYLAKGNEAERVRVRELYINGHSLTGENGIRKMLGAVDVEFFGRAYFPHYFSKPSPAFHRDLDAIWHEGVLKGNVPINKISAKVIDTLEGCRRGIAAPRGHAKSTNLTFKGTMHAVLYEYKHYPVILSDSTEQAEGFLDNLRVEFEENEAIREDFGELPGKVWRNNVLLTKTNIKIEAIGSGKKIRGRKHRNWRPDLLILDDVENDENVRTLEQRKKLDNWFKKAVTKSGDYYTDIIYIGTLLHYDSLLAGVLNNPRYKSVKYKAVISFATWQVLWDEWEKIYTDLSNPANEEDALEYYKSNEARMLEGTKVLWEEKNSYYNLMVEKVSSGDAAFNSELQNEPINPDDCLFNEEWFDYYNEAEMDFKDKVFEFFGFIDPSLGKSKKSDYSAIITLAKHKTTGYMYVLDADVERRHPDRIIGDTIEKEVWLKKTYGRGYKKLGVETVQFQWFFKEELAKASAKQGVYLPIEEVNQHADKTMRIQTLQPDIKNKYIKFNKRHRLLLEQLMYFPMGSHDDAPDALEGARTIAKKSKRFKLFDRSLLGI